ncbi:hypothetical protein HK097_002493 [Rhizophlyctis rosea]|uniref:Nicotinamide-nucleotide adenylyltransferase n=1 Tax=Rhizophlyctis rosea TaxID=64517 RepID=A0AAD5SIH2_9FUNG|nr:hypothetical protein HK097_002493 [Rhizophlyctis rosea]
MTTTKATPSATVSTPTTPPPKPAILVLGGAFNPIHTQHIALLTQTKHALLLTHPHHWSEILGAYLALAPDGYVKRKCQSKSEKAMHFSHRLALAKACIPSCQSSSIEESGHKWISSPPHFNLMDRPWGSAGELGRKVREALLRDKVDADIIIVVGADRAMKNGGRSFKWRNEFKPGVYMAVVGREDIMPTILAAWDADVKSGLVLTPNATVLLEEAVEPVSSTLVRGLLRQVHAESDTDAKKRSMLEIVGEGYLTEGQAAYLLENEKDLYM